MGAKFETLSSPHLLWVFAGPLAEVLDAATWLVVAATGEEQLGSLPGVLKRFPPDNVLWAGPPLPRSTYDS